MNRRMDTQHFKNRLIQGLTLACVLALWSAPSFGQNALLGGTPRDFIPGEKPEVGLSGGLSALAMAARDNHIETVRTLIEAGADVNLPAADGSSPLLISIMNGHYELASMLIDAGADVNQQAANGWPPLFAAVDRRNIDNSVTIPFKSDGDPFPLIQKLLASGARPNARVITAPIQRGSSGGGHTWLIYDGGTALIRAAFGGDIDVIRLLMAYGADPMMTTHDGTTALMAASGMGWIGGYSTEQSEEELLETIRFLVEMGNDVNARVETHGRSALHAAANRGSNAIVQQLVDLGGDLSLHDYGATEDSSEPLMPLDYAIGVRFGPNAIVTWPDTEAFMRQLMAERGIEHTTSECTLRGFTCGDVDPADFASMTPEEQEALRERGRRLAAQLGISSTAGSNIDSPASEQ